MPGRILFVTTALPYANGPFHIGHIMEYIQADIWVRFQRMQGHSVHFVCADDAHGAAIMLRAEADGTTPEELIARVAESHKRDYQRFHLSFDNWYTTHSPENVELSQLGTGEAREHSLHCGNVLPENRRDDTFATRSQGNDANPAIF